MKDFPEFEKAVLACCFKSPNLALSIKHIANADFFKESEHAIIWKGLRSYLERNGTNIDVSMLPVAVVSELKRLQLDSFVNQEQLNSIVLKKDVSPDNFRTYFKPMLNRYQTEKTKEMIKELDCKIKGNCDYESLKKIMKEYSCLDISSEASEPQSLVAITDSNILDRIEALNSPLPKRKYWETGFKTLNKFIRFLPKNVYCIGARPSVGKSLIAKNNILMENNSTKRICDLVIGDRVASIDGKESIVTGVFPQGELPVYRVNFEDGRFVDCSLDHLWEVQQSMLFSKVITTEEIMQKLEHGWCLEVPVAHNDKLFKTKSYLKISSVENLNKEDECVCISVSHPRKLYVLDNYICTHNTTFARSIMYNIAKNNKYKVEFFSLEMSKDEILTGFCCSKHGISFDQYSAMHESEQIALLEKFKSEMKAKEVEIYIDDSLMEINDIVLQIKKDVKEKDIDIVFIDYLQLATLDSMPIQEGVNENALITAILRILKKCAKEINRPIVVLSQLNRSIETREDKTPLLSDLRGSGSIEQDCTAVMFLYREEFYKKNKCPENKKGILDVIFAKNRMGKTGLVSLNFNGEHGIIYE